ncbi:UNVERIFIED_CONTAM: hypothetical protein Sangu_2816700 [Sesamum angustifolium]|uniref:Aminotransferase-like plant mobile domain-containing protein n=1 Tax=Sesamum angustifolium TaxID=2727405 RepID=A0AAW2IS29_9LAMI
MSLLVTNHQTTSPIYALWAVLSLKVMQSGMAIFVLPRISLPKDIGSGLRTCLADVEIDCAISKYMMLFMLHCLLMTTIPISSKRFAKHGASYKYFAYFVGEMSISLWDLHELVGLPMTGCLYDEVVLSALELTGVDEKRERFIPRSCKYLLYVYHLLQSVDDNRCSHVSIDKWVKFWSKKTTKYHPPPPRKEKKTFGLSRLITLLVILQFTRGGRLLRRPYLPSYALKESQGRSLFGGLFSLLALLVCSSCRYELLFSYPLVYAWLACYFKTHYSVWQELRGPKMTRFSGEGGAKYYEPREARKRIHKAEFVSWACNMLVKAEPFKFVDDGRAEELDHSYFVAIRSSYLTLRQGGRFIIEPYSPHRFGRQFGYYQDVPGTLRCDTRVASLEEGLRYWRLCVLSKSSSKAWFPCLPANAKKLCSYL